MTQYLPTALTETDDGERLFALWNGLIPAYLTGQAGTSVPGGAGKGFAYTKLDGSGNILGLFIADGAGGEVDASPDHVLRGITDPAAARDALGLTGTATIIAQGRIFTNGSIDYSTGILSSTRANEGRYDLTLAAPLPDADYTVFATVEDDGGIYYHRVALVTDRTSTGFRVRIIRDGFNDYSNNSFMFMVARAA